MSIKNFKEIVSEGAFKRLEDISTMLFPSTRFYNRMSHTYDVCEVAKMLSSVFKKHFKLPYLYESCLVHDIGHCCFSHEGEEIFSEFVSNTLNISKYEFSFSHAVNGALIVYYALKTSKNTELKNILLYDTKKLNTILNNAAKHSFSYHVANGIYFNFVNEILARSTRFRLKISKDVNRVNKTCYFLRVADDISSKRTDIVDLIKLYFHKNGFPLKIFSKDKYLKNIISDYYIEKLFLTYNSLYITSSAKFNIESELYKLDVYQFEKSFLKMSYKFPYKLSVTENAKVLLRELLERIFNDPYLLKKIPGYGKMFYFIIKNFRDSSKKYLGKVYIPKLYNIKKFLNDYKNDGSTCHKFVLINYVCSIVYEFSNLTDKLLITLAEKIDLITSLSINAKNALSYLKNL